MNIQITKNYQLTQSTGMPQHKPGYALACAIFVLVRITRVPGVF